MLNSLAMHAIHFSDSKRTIFKLIMMESTLKLIFFRRIWKKVAVFVFDCKMLRNPMLSKFRRFRLMNLHASDLYSAQPLQKVFSTICIWKSEACNVNCCTYVSIFQKKSQTKKFLGSIFHFFVKIHSHLMLYKQIVKEFVQFVRTNSQKCKILTGSGYSAKNWDNYSKNWDIGATVHVTNFGFSFADCTEYFL